MQVHSNSSTNVQIRAVMRSSSATMRSVAAHYGVSTSTVHRWKHRESGQELSSRPQSVRCALDPLAGLVGLFLRTAHMTLDECLEVLETAFPMTRRATLHRFFVAQGCGRIHVEATKREGSFKEYEPGFVHMDCFYIPALGGKKRYCFVAIDRATRLAFLAIYDTKDRFSARDFLERAASFFPFHIHTLLTDNGSEFTNRFYKPAAGGAKGIHLVDRLCQALGIEHRLTKPGTPATNGMAERFVGLAKHATVSKYRYSGHDAIENALSGWLALYNLHRKHGSLGRKTPMQMAQWWYKHDPDVFTRDPDIAPSAFATY